MALIAAVEIQKVVHKAWKECGLKKTIPMLYVISRSRQSRSRESSRPNIACSRATRSCCKTQRANRQTQIQSPFSSRDTSAGAQRKNSLRLSKVWAQNNTCSRHRASFWSKNHRWYRSNSWSIQPRPDCISSNWRKRRKSLEVRLFRSTSIRKLSMIVSRSRTQQPPPYPPQITKSESFAAE